MAGLAPYLTRIRDMWDLLLESPVAGRGGHRPVGCAITVYSTPRRPRTAADGYGEGGIRTLERG